MAFGARSLFLVWHIVQCAGKQCSDSVGTCSSQPRASLMQTRSAKKLVLSAVEAAATRTQTLAGYKEYVNKLVDQYKQDPTSRKETTDGDGDVDNAITTIIQYISSMYEDLKIWHTQDVADAEACSSTALFDKCSGVLPDVNASGHSTDDVARSNLNEYMTNVEVARTSHTDCRAGCSEAVCDDSLACVEYNRYRKEKDAQGHLTASFTEHVSCANPYLDDSYIKTSDDEKLKQMEECLKKSKTWLDPLYERYIACHNSEETCTSCQSECDSKQAAFEAAHCQLDIFRDITCDGYRNCYEQALEQCSTNKCPNIEVRSAARAADNETGELIICLLGALRAPEEERAATLRTCDDLPNLEHSAYWNIDCAHLEDTPPVVGFCGDAEQPCNSAFTTHEYVSNGWTLTHDNQICLYKACDDDGVPLEPVQHNAGTYGRLNTCTECNVAHHYWNPHVHVS